MGVAGLVVGFQGAGSNRWKSGGYVTISFNGRTVKPEESNREKWGSLNDIAMLVMETQDCLYASSGDGNWGLRFAYRR